MLYQKDISSDELDALGTEWQNRLDAVINTAITTARQSNDGTTANSRVLKLIGNKAMSIRYIVAAHNVIHGADSMSLNYGRYVVQALLKAGLIKRVRHGLYVDSSAEAP